MVVLSLALAWFLRCTDAVRGAMAKLELRSIDGAAGPRRAILSAANVSSIRVLMLADTGMEFVRDGHCELPGLDRLSRVALTLSSYASMASRRASSLR